MRTDFFAALLGAVIVCSVPVFAQTDTTFTYQGELMESGNTASGAYSMEFTLFDALAGGSQVGLTVTIPAQTVSDGIFNSQLDFGARDFSGSHYWLEIVVDGNTLSPRQPLTASPFSIQTRGIFVDDSGNIGIGTNDPQHTLHVESGFSAAIVGRVTEDTGGGSGVIGRTNSVFGHGVQGIAGHAISSNAAGVLGWAQALSGISYGVKGTADSDEGVGVRGIATSETGQNYGVFGSTQSEFGIGVYGTGQAFGVYGSTSNWSGSGVYGEAKGSSGISYGVRGASNSSNGYDFFADGLGVDYGTSSSIRWKSNIVNIDNPLDKLAQLRGVYYNWDEEHGGQHAVGMIAEEVGKVLPEIVGYEENGVDAIGMDYSKLTPLLVEATNALRAEKDAQINQLKDENQLLKSRLDRLERMMTLSIDQ